MKILVTGANGFVGTHLSKKLLEQGHTVYGLARNPSKILLKDPHFIVIKGDLNIAPYLWLEHLPADLDVCVHTAGLVHSYSSKDFFMVNSMGTKDLIEGLKLKFEKLKFILISSLAAAGPGDFGEIKDTTMPDFPVSDYGRSKKEAEEILAATAPKTWTTSIIRPPMVIGPGDAAVLDIFKMVKSRIIILPGINSMLKEYSFVCVFDLIETISLVIKSEKAHFLYSANKEIVTFKDLIRSIKKRMNIRAVIYIPIPIFIIEFISKLLFFISKIFNHGLRLTPDKIFELRGLSWACSNEESVNELHQEYNWPLHKTIDATYEDYKKRNWI